MIVDEGGASGRRKMGATREPRTGWPHIREYICPDGLFQRRSRKYVACRSVDSQLRQYTMIDNDTVLQMIWKCVPMIPEQAVRLLGDHILDLIIADLQLEW